MSLDNIIQQDQKIVLPQSPFLQELKSFGGMEAVALVVNMAATTVFSRYTQDPTLLSWIGPIAEKFGFAGLSTYKSLRAYLREVPDNRTWDKLGEYGKEAGKDFVATTIKDIIAHDLFYVGIMEGGLRLAPQTSPTILSGFSFVVPILGVAAGKVALEELQYKWFQRALRKCGSGSEKYYESRFEVDRGIVPSLILDQFEQKFGLHDRREGEYHDLYFGQSIPGYNNRRVRLRARDRNLIESDERHDVKTLQVVFTRPSEIALKNPNQFRYFPTEKLKMYREIPGEVPKRFEDFDPAIQRVLKRYQPTNEPLKTVSFTRAIARNETLLVTADTVEGNGSYYIVEIKTHKHIPQLIEAMHYFMREFACDQTTRDKYLMSA